MAEAGIGIADALLLIGPSVYAYRQFLRGLLSVGACFPTSRGRRTENMPLSCDMMGK